MPSYRCPYCGREYAKQTMAVTHIRACYNLKHASNPDPITEWKLTQDDKKFLKANRILDDPPDGRKDS